MKKVKQIPRQVLVIVGLGVILIILAVVSDSNRTKNTASEAVVPTARVSITAEGFVPANLLVEKGTKVIWENTDDKPHQVQANPYPSGESLPELRSNILDTSQTYEFTVEQSGEFGYHDGQNPEINGTFTVR